MNKLIYILAIVFISCNLMAQQRPKSELFFPLQDKHVHASGIVELPNGDLLTCWFEGSGKRRANDVVIKGSRLKRGDKEWKKPFLMADYPGQPDCNPVLFLNKEGKLFLVWIVVQANMWENSLLKVKTTVNYTGEGAPDWQWQDNILMKPGDEFAKRIKEQFDKNGRQDLAWAGYALPYEELLIETANDPVKRET